MTAAGTVHPTTIAAGCIWTEGGYPAPSMAIIPASGMNTEDISVSIIMMCTETGTTVTRKDTQGAAARKDLLEAVISRDNLEGIASRDNPLEATSRDNPAAVTSRYNPEGITSRYNPGGVTSGGNPEMSIKDMSNNDNGQYHESI